MDYPQRQKLYQLMAQYWPHSRLAKDASTRTAWGRVLEKFPYDDVKNRVLELAATSKYPPDLADLTATLVPPSGGPQGAAGIQPSPPGQADRRVKEGQDLLFAKMEQERNRLIPLRRAAGIPATMEEASAAGMSYTDWMSALEERGLNYPESIF